MKRLLAAIALAVVATGCMPKAAPPPETVPANAVDIAKKKSPDVTAEQLENGRKLFVAHCGECHKHPDLAAQPLSKWPDIFEDMANNTPVDAGTPDRADFKTFVLTAAEAAGAPQN
jgi:mono/diheme cytochrome c family protein